LKHSFCGKFYKIEFISVKSGELKGWLMQLISGTNTLMQEPSLD